MTGSVADFTTTLSSVVTAVKPIMDWVGPIAMASIFLYFIRSFFD